MKINVFIFFFLLGLNFISYAQSVRVKNFDESKYKEVTGLHSTAFHHSSYYHNNKKVKVFLMEGEYWLFAGEELVFGENININSAPSGIELLKEANHYKFEIKDEGNYYFEISTENSVANFSELLFVIYKAYDPTQSEIIESFSYKTVANQIISSDETNSRYSVIYFTGRKNLIKRDQIAEMNSLKKDFNNVQFLCLFYESEDELAAFKKQTNFAWNLIPSINSRELTKYQIGKLISEPSVYLVENNQNKIIYYYYGNYALPRALRTALNKL